jgi:hypothetical protein
MSYYSKYLKYKEKYLQLKNQQGGLPINYEVVFIWINKQKQIINQEIKDRIVRNMKKWKTYNPEVKLLLYVDSRYTERVDIDYFRSLDHIVLKDFRRLLNRPELVYLFEEDKPIYLRVDIAKIIIKYDLLVKHQDIASYYVIISDIDILTIDDDYDHERGLTCDDPEHMMKNFTQNEIFDELTMYLLDKFGYVMTKESRLPPENGFMIFKNDPDIIKSLKEFLIDKIICEMLFQLFRDKIDTFGDYTQHKTLEVLNETYNLCTHFIYNLYHWFAGYLNIIKKYQILNTTIMNGDIDITKIPKENIIYSDDKEQSILIDNAELFMHINNNYKDIPNYLLKFTDYTDLGRDFSNSTGKLTEKGVLISKDYLNFIYPYPNHRDYDTRGYFNQFLRPSKCVKIEKSNTTNINNREMCPQLFI